MKRCLYCDQEKSESEFSEEHVLPQAVGGNLSPRNPFKTSDVCRRCNNLCGWFLDAGFIKNWFTQAGRAEEARRRVRFDQNTIFPLTRLNRRRIGAPILGQCPLGTRPRHLVLTVEPCSADCAGSPFSTPPHGKRGCRNWRAGSLPVAPALQKNSFPARRPTEK